VSQLFPTRIRFAEALAIIDRVAAAARLTPERLPLSRCLGLVLAQDLVAETELPGFDNSAMDGYALRAADASEAGALLNLVGEQFAGLRQELELGAGECLRITTGAAMPKGADSVVMKEDSVVEGGSVRFLKAVAFGQHLRRKGEDVALGDRVLTQGQVLTPGALALAAALGQADLLVRPRPTVAIFTSGDELRPPGQALAPGEIHDSNRVLLQTLLLAEGYQPVAWPVLPDEPGQIAAALNDAAQSFDLVLTCGGVSAGERDYLPAFMAEQGQVHFWKVLMRPGMPVLAGRLGRAQIICLPGNPVSVLATFLALALRLLDGMQGRGEPRPVWKAQLASGFSKRHDRLEFLRGQLRQDSQGVLWVEPNPADGSHRLRAVADSNALVVLPEGAAEWAPGSLLDVLPLPGR
jgi:molybdopterin molybdotransferase